MPACEVVRVEGGKIKSGSHYFDMLTMLTQIGAMQSRSAAALAGGGKPASSRRRPRSDGEFPFRRTQHRSLLPLSVEVSTEPDRELGVGEGLQQIDAPPMSFVSVIVS